MTMNALITAARAPHALAMIRSFGEKGWRVTAGDSTRLSMGLYSRHVAKKLLYPEVTEKPKEFLQTILHELENTPYDLLCPTFEEIFLLARVRDKLDQLVPHLVPPYEELLALHNKASLAELCARHGVPSPMTLQPASLDELDAKADELAYPVVIKLAETNNSLGLNYADDAEQLRKRYRKLVNFFRLEPAQYPLVQQKIEGEILFSLFFADRGETVGQLIYRPLRMFPEGGGTAFYREAIRHERIERLAHDFIAKLNWHGFIGFDFIIDKNDGTPYLIDANPRPTPAYNTGLAAGIDFTQMLINLSTKKKPVPNLTPREGVRSKMLFVEILWFCFQFLPGKSYFRRVRDALSVFKKRVFVPDVHRRDDRLPSLILTLYTNWFMFVINTIKPRRGGFMYGCNYDRALANKVLDDV